MRNAPFSQDTAGSILYVLLCQQIPGKDQNQQGVTSSPCQWLSAPSPLDTREEVNL